MMASLLTVAVAVTVLWTSTPASATERAPAETTSVSAESQSAKMFNSVSTPKSRIDVGRLGLTGCVASVALSKDLAVEACKHFAKDSGPDYGIRVCLVSSSDGTTRIVFESVGAGDAETAKLYLLKDTSASDTGLVVADFAADLPYGTAIFKWSGMQLIKIGDIPIVRDAGDGELAGVGSLIEAETKGDFLLIQLRGKLLKPRPNGDYEPVPGDLATFEYDGKRFKAIVRDAKLD